MFTSDNGAVCPNAKAVGRSLIYLGVSVFLALFGAVYELFSHGVYSYFMIYSFAVPLLGGCLPWLLAAKGFIPGPGTWSGLLMAFAVSVLSTGSVFRGVLEIYGTTNRLSAVYLWAGIALCVLFAAVYSAEAVAAKRKPQA